MNLRHYLYSIKQYFQNKAVCDELKKYKNIHQGQRCFIIGTGPSLTTDDLELLKDEITFGSNRIFEIYSRTDWRPTYYMNQDFQLIEKYADEIEKLDAMGIFLPVEFRERFAGKKGVCHFVLRHRDFYPKASPSPTVPSRWHIIWAFPRCTCWGLTTIILLVLTRRAFRL